MNLDLDGALEWFWDKGRSVVDGSMGMEEEEEKD